MKNRLDRVEEFRLLRKLASKHNVNIYLFGGSATAFVHYVRLDLLRESGELDLRAGKFDYKFNSIFKARQDFDIVFDVSLGIPNIPQTKIMDEVTRFYGKERLKTNWDPMVLARILTEDKFNDVHSDSGSHGLVKISNHDSEESIFYDQRGWELGTNQFSEDASKANISFFHTNKHENASITKEGNNPEVVSAIRFLSKAAQYGLHISQHDMELVAKIIARANIKNLKDYPKKRILYFGSKALTNSIDIQYAWNLLVATGARDLILALHEQETITEYENELIKLRQEPLVSRRVGGGAAPTAAELNLSHVSFLPDDYLEFEKLTTGFSKHPSWHHSTVSLSPVSSKQGLDPTEGLKIFFKLNPLSRQGSDFLLEDGSFTLLNPNAIELVERDYSFNELIYLELILNQSISGSSLQDSELYRKIEALLFSNSNVSSNIIISQQEEQRIAEKIKLIFSQPSINRQKVKKIIELWFGSKIHKQKKLISNALVDIYFQDKISKKTSIHLSDEIVSVLLGYIQDSYSTADNFKFLIDENIAVFLKSDFLSKLDFIKMGINYGLSNFMTDMASDFLVSYIDWVVNSKVNLSLGYSWVRRSNKPRKMSLLNNDIIRFLDIGLKGRPEALSTIVRSIKSNFFNFINSNLRLSQDGSEELLIHDWFKLEISDNFPELNSVFFDSLIAHESATALNYLVYIANTAFIRPAWTDKPSHLAMAKKVVLHLQENGKSIHSSVLNRVLSKSDCHSRLRAN